MKLRRVLLPIALLSLFVSNKNAASGSVYLFDNIGNPSSSTTGIHAAGWVAQSFATDGNNYSLESVMVPLQFLWGTPTAEMAICSNLSGIPGPAVGVLISPSSYPSQPLENVTFTTSGIALEPNSTYWVVVTGNVFNWASTFSVSGSGPGFRTDYAFFDPFADQWTVNAWGVVPQLMQVTADIIPVPEPSGLMLLVLWIAGFMGARRLQ